MSNAAAVTVDQPSKSSRSQIQAPASDWPARVLDIALVGSFLGLAFLLGMFPLKDTDFWWHLREGDEIRRTWQLPIADNFTFGAEGRPWIDLHWTFQVLLSWGYQLGGVPLLTLAKCVITCAALFLLITARRKSWPFEVMLVAWIPALIVLGGRMYVRPETISLLYLCAYLAILFRLDERPRLAYLLPVVQMLWVNVQGLFILGPIVLAFYLIGAALSPGALEKSRKPWWRTVVSATAGVGVACLLNPYALSGALYPLQLAATMRNKVFSRTIGELQSIPDFIDKAGLNNLPLQFHLATAALGLLSFVLPLVWFLWTSLLTPRETANEAEAGKKKKAKTSKRSKRGKQASVASATSWIFRILLFAAFTALSVQATRNSHQFAAVVGTVTAWNLGEWVAAIHQRRLGRKQAGPVPTRPVGKALALGILWAMIVLVGSGRLYAWMGEGRIIGIGEEHLWFPHDAVKAAGRPGMPDRSLCYHNGHASLYEYAYAPERRTFADARLEVIGPEIYQYYVDLESRVRSNTPNWQHDLRDMKYPVVLADNVHPVSGAFSASMITARGWRCVWFDPVAALYLHESHAEAYERDQVDFLARHFDHFAATEPPDPQRHVMQTKAYWNIVYALIPKQGEVPRPEWRETMRPLIAIGQDHARRVRALTPNAIEGWKYEGLLEFFRDMPDSGQSARFRMPFDPVLDLSAARATYALVKAQEIDPLDANVLATLSGLYLQRGMNDQAVKVLEDFLARPATGPDQRASQAKARLQLGPLQNALGSPPSLEWKNLDELERALNICLSQGRVQAAVDLLEKAHPIEARPWAITDKIATMRLHLGQPEAAHKLWSEARDAPSPGLQQSRAAMASLAMADFVAAFEGFHAAVAADSKRFESLYGLALTEFDSGNAAAAFEAATQAVAVATEPTSKSAAATIVDMTRAHRKPRTQPEGKLK